MSLMTTSITSSEAVFRRIREDIVRGALPPDGKLRLRTLKDRYGVGGSPIREALSRLLTERLVRTEGGRGFWVSSATAEDLSDIIEFRKIIEGAALRRSVENGTEDWELEIVAAFHRLQKQGRRLANADDHWFDEWEPLHRAFHRSLVAACGSPRMLQQIDQLYTETERYRRSLMSYRPVAEEAVAEHRLLMESVLERDLEKAAELHARHLNLTTELVDALGAMPVDD